MELVEDKSLKCDGGRTGTCFTGIDNSYRTLLAQSSPHSPFQSQSALVDGVFIAEMDTSDLFDRYQNAEGPDLGNVDGVKGRLKQRRTVDILGQRFDHDLLASKVFYFCFFSAFGSLFPLIAVYFKQLGMTGAQAGMLIGVRPFVEFASAPFWGSFANRFRKGKILLLFSLGSWIVFTLAIGFVEPGTPYCLTLYRNKSGTYTELTMAGETIKGGALGVIKEATGLRKKRQTDNFGAIKLVPTNSHIEKKHIVGIAPEYITKDKVSNYDSETYEVLVSPPFNTRVYRKSAVDQVFMLLLLLIILGEFFSAPAIALVDACTLSYVTDRPGESFGKQRLFGSVGWGLAMFVIGIGLDYSNTFPNHPCPTRNTTEKNYTLCFAVFSVLMAAAMFVAAQFPFADEQQQHRPDDVPALIMDTRIDEVDPAVAENARVRGPQPQGVGPDWLSTLKTFASPHYAVFLFSTCCMGFGAGLIFAFLFWHLQDLGGSPFLFGMASILNHATEIVTYFFSFRLINHLGHVKVIYLSLAANVVRFFYISWLQNPWFVLPFQCVQGATHAIMWATATSYISLAAPPTQKASAQAMQNMIFHGIGKGSGALIGGMIISSIGTQQMFQMYALVCLLSLVSFFGINGFFKVEGIKYREGLFEDDGAGVLAPQGIPMGYEDNLTDKFGQTTENYGTMEEATRDPTQDAYDRYVQEPYAKHGGDRFDTLPRR